jgi:hypothetical protein
VEATNCAPKPAKKRQYLFSYGVDQHDFRQINDQPNARALACYQHPSVLGIATGKSALEFQVQSISRAQYLHAEHHVSSRMSVAGSA